MAGQLPTKGWNVKIMKDSEEIGYATSVSWDVDTGLENYYQLGSATPAAIVEGNVEITGTIERAFVDTKLLGLVMDSSGVRVPQVEFTIVAQAPNPANLSSGDSYYQITLEGVKIETLSNEFPQDGFLGESVDFRARNIKIESLTVA